jgi:Acyltransferase family.
MNSQSVFSKSHTTFFKGIGILMIVIHNYCHFQQGFKLENEESFNSENVWVFLSHLQSGNLKSIFTAVFAFLGHFGVQLFIFFSAYGLAIKFSRRKESVCDFVLRRLKKIYFLLGFAILFWIIFTLSLGTVLYPKSVVYITFLLASTISNFTNVYLFKIFSGPYWFFGLIIQLYLLFPIFYKFLKRFNMKSLWIPFLLVYLLIMPLHYFTAQNTFSLFGNVFGHLPEVFLGIAMAQKQFKSFSKGVVFLSALIFAGSQFFEFLFPFSFLCVTILLIQGISWLEENSNSFLKKFVLYTGTISMILFIVNGPLRSHPLFSIENQELRFVRILIFLPILFVLSHLLFKIYSFLTAKLKI